MIATAEVSEAFACFGSSCSVHVTGAARGIDAAGAVANTRRKMLAWHERFTRFAPTSELSALNDDPRTTVPASAHMREFVSAVLLAARHSGGLVDGTLLEQVQAAGYRRSIAASLPLSLALALAPRRGPAGPSVGARWREVVVDDDRGTVTRPPGMRFDSGGLAKGLFADLVAGELGCYESFAINCAGDLRIGGRSGVARDVEVQSPFDSSVLHTFSLTGGGIATSGIGRRSWLDANGRPAHHLLDPASGRPAYTGIVQATALASSALDAEMRAKAALLSGPECAAEWLPDGGALVLEDGSCIVLAASGVLKDGVYV